MLGGDDAHALQFAVEHIAKINLALERIGEFDVNALHRLAFRPGLAGHEPLAQQIARRLLHLVIGAAEFDAARLAARAGVDLRLDDPMRAAEFGRRVHRLIRAKGDRAGRNGDPVGRQNFLGLILVHVHVVLPGTTTVFVFYEPILPRTTA